MLEQSQDFDDVQIRNKTDELATLSISGPKSRDLLEQLCDEDVSSNSFKFMQNKQMNISGVPVLALRVSYTGILLRDW